MLRPEKGIIWNQDNYTQETNTLYFVLSNRDRKLDKSNAKIDESQQKHQIKIIRIFPGFEV